MQEFDFLSVRDLEDNKITTIPVGIFTGFTSLQFL